MTGRNVMCCGVARKGISASKSIKGPGSIHPAPVLPVRRSLAPPFTAVFLSVEARELGGA